MDWISRLRQDGLIIASGNPKKLEEFRRILSPLSIVVRSAREAGLRGDDPEESEDTFEGNAALKAVHAARVLGVPAIADDSGLVVDALNGDPGVYSARYGGEGLNDTQRYELLLRNLENTPDDQRTARFVAVLAIALPEGTTYTFRGEAEGFIARHPDGEGGFGYDPVFIHGELNQSFASMSPESKDRISHRGRALRKLLEFLESGH